MADIPGETEPGWIKPLDRALSERIEVLVETDSTLFELEWTEFDLTDSDELEWVAFWFLDGISEGFSGREPEDEDSIDSGDSGLDASPKDWYDWESEPTDSSSIGSKKCFREDLLADLEWEWVLAKERCDGFLVKTLELFADPMKSVFL